MRNKENSLLGISPLNEAVDNSGSLVDRAAQAGIPLEG